MNKTIFNKIKKETATVEALIQPLYEKFKTETEGKIYKFASEPNLPYPFEYRIGNHNEMQYITFEDFTGALVAQTDFFICCDRKERMIELLEEIKELVKGIYLK